MQTVLLGPDGQPIDRSRLLHEEAAPTFSGVRSAESEDPSTGLTPSALAGLLRATESGDPSAYFQLAERIEEKDSHYVSVLRTRRLACSSLLPVIDAASEKPNDVAIADFAREIVSSDAVRNGLFDILDAIPKGISVTEILWDLSGAQWRPFELRLVEPRWIDFDPLDRRTPMLRSGPDEPGAGVPARPDSRSRPTLKPLAPFKFIVCNIQAKSGLPIRSGLARPATWAYLFKNFDLKAWLQFAEIYGMPLRVGKYQPGATPEEKRTLLRALAQIAADAAAIVPQSMAIEFVEAQGNRDGVMFEKLATYLDLQMSKLVLGQTTTTDAVSGGHAVSEEHEKVREDIRDADAVALAMTLKRDLLKPAIDLNFGPQKIYPNLRFQPPETFDIQVMSSALAQLVPVGLEVEMSQVRDKLGFTEPAKDAKLLKAPAPVSPFGQLPGNDAPPSLATAFNRLTVALASANRTGDDVDAITGKTAIAARPAIDAAIERIRNAVHAAASFEDLAATLLKIAETEPDKAIAAALRDGTVLARLAGAAEAAR